MWNHAPSGQWTTGIYANSGKPKPAFDAWRFPFVTNRKSKSKVQAWGKAPASGKLKIQKKHGHKWRSVKRLKVKGGKIFKKKLRVRGRRSCAPGSGTRRASPGLRAGSRPGTTPGAILRRTSRPSPQAGGGVFFLRRGVLPLRSTARPELETESISSQWPAETFESQ
jgi:hypothetical protein